MTPDGPPRLAVYGTLAPGGSNESVLDAVEGRWEAGTVVGTRHADGWHGYPGLELDGRGRVDVHVLHAAELAGHLARLDEFEGPGYRRTVVDVRLDDGREVEAWIYVLRAPPA